MSGAVPKIPAKLFLKGALWWGGAMFVVFQVMITVFLLVTGQAGWPLYGVITAYNLVAWAIGGLAWSALTLFLSTRMERLMSRRIDAVLSTILDPQERVAFRAPGVVKKNRLKIYGDLLVTDRRVLFIPTPGWWQRKVSRLSFAREDVKSVDLASRSLISMRPVEDETGTSLVLVTKAGEEAAFFVGGRPGVMDEVRRAVFQ